jgi:hypothetical protein
MTAIKDGPDIGIEAIQQASASKLDSQNTSAEDLGLYLNAVFGGEGKGFLFTAVGNPTVTASGKYSLDPRRETWFVWPDEAEDAVAAILEAAQIVEVQLNRPGMSGDSISWEGWGHVRWFVEEVPAGAA